MLDMLHKFILTSLLGFFPFNAQLPFGLSVACGYMIVLLLVKPYKRNRDGMYGLNWDTEVEELKIQNSTVINDS